MRKVDQQMSKDRNPKRDARGKQPQRGERRHKPKDRIGYTPNFLPKR